MVSNTFESRYVILIAALIFAVLLIAAQVATAQTFVRICDPFDPPVLTLVPPARTDWLPEMGACVFMDWKDTPVACGMTRDCVPWLAANRLVYPSVIKYARLEYYPPNICGADCWFVDGVLVELYLPLILK